MSQHNCGGTILTGGTADNQHLYCDRCHAFIYASEGSQVPSGTNEKANGEAWDAGDAKSPEAKQRREKTRAPREGFRVHDHGSAYQICDTCGIETGAGITSEWDDVYYAQTDPSACPDPDCDGIMCLTAEDGDDAETPVIRTATMFEQGNGFASAGGYARGDDDEFYRIVSLGSGRIQTGEHGEGDRIEGVIVQLVDWSDCDEKDEAQVGLVLDKQ